MLPARFAPRASPRCWKRLSRRTALHTPRGPRRASAPGKRWARFMQRSTSACWCAAPRASQSRALLEVHATPAFPSRSLHQARFTRATEEAVRNDEAVAALRGEQVALLGARRFSDALENLKLVKAAEAKARLLLRARLACVSSLTVRM